MTDDSGPTTDVACPAFVIMLLRYSLFTLSKTTKASSSTPPANLIFSRSPGAACCAWRRQRLLLQPREPHPSERGALPTPRSRGARAPLPRATRRFASVGGGGGERNRTDDLLLAKQALSQLSYTPSASGEARRRRRQRLLWQPREPHRAGWHPSLAGASSGSVPPLPRLLSQPLTRLAISASPKRVVGQGGFEPPTSRLSSARSNQLSY